MKKTYVSTFVIVAKKKLNLCPELKTRTLESGELLFNPKKLSLYISFSSFTKAFLSVAPFIIIRNVPFCCCSSGKHTQVSCFSFVVCQWGALNSPFRGNPNGGSSRGMQVSGEMCDSTVILVQTG